MKADAKKISNGVYWVGVLDWDIRSYHGYTLTGTTYNTYLVFGEEKVALIDNGYPGTFPQMWGRIENAFEKEGKDVKIDVIIQNHIEKDHSGTLFDIHKKFPDAAIYCTDKAASGLKEHYNFLKEISMKTVKTGDYIDLGSKQMVFLEAPMIHWPDSMFTLLVEDGILFSNDAFGQHLCLSERFDNEIPENILMEAAQKFFANLVTPLSPLVLRKFAEVKELDLLDKIKIIAPSHGQIWTDPMKIIGAYTDWATGKCKDKVTIIYDTMHSSTQKMSHAIAEGVMSEDVEVVMYFLHQDERSEIVKDILDSKAVLFGSPTIFNGPFPSLGDIMYYLSGLSFDRTGFKRLSVAFGSKGWGGGATRKLSEELSKCGFEVLETIDSNFVPGNDDLDKCYEVGKTIAQKIKDI
ncbi:FprA family A-type flavoprotein [Methanobacterium alcaliphilum]|uniref:FprA family A-type flavoprotein n=1 Tax=Methanobacterium alcaliphilum TaxID=392018 RepID=UPI00200A65BB|nr:FprA family A-type flavoprotein [Methanobacterium alcaliphilum]MCK9152395.1 FprA family A-type flavoprotein [Methanobacterium alcaliphilum]